MTSSRIKLLAFAAVYIVVAAACSGGGSGQDMSAQSPVTASKPALNQDGVESPGKITAPVTIDYQVIGNPVVGQPVAVNLNVVSTSGEQPVTLRYRINDSSSMVFPDAQANMVQLSAGRNEAQRAQQVTVVPQREGRLYLNVSAEVQTANGLMFKSLAVPIQVGSAPADMSRNGELKETADGEEVISMPAEESQ